MRQARRGFTLIELVSVITVLAVLAALAMPKIVTLRDTALRQAYFAEMRLLAADASEVARERNLDAVVRYDSSESAFLIEIEPQEGEVQVVRRIETVPEIEVDRFRRNGQDTSESEWELRFFPDGRADSGSVEVAASGLVYHLRVGRSGRSTWERGEAPIEETKWEAGQLETRA